MNTFNRPYLFMSGEPTVATTLAFSNSKWDCISVPTKLVQSEYALDKIRRENRPREVLSGIIHYADVSDKEIEKHNLRTIVNYNIPCWPDPRKLMVMIDRHVVLKECKEAGFIDHDIVQSDEFAYQMPFPFVLKTGTEHRGIGKYLIRSVIDIPEWEGIATMEPYFEGESVRVLIIGSEVFSFKTTNHDSWIKNSPGADIEKCSVPTEMIQHAKECKQYFSLDIAGMDYILEDDGTFHFLEINQYPGLGVFEDTEECGKALIKEKMYAIEMKEGKL